jgi:UDP-4-amino-4,6-dideoxy-N-acetyl-beta-L-altrosamine transaminase
MIPYGRQSIDDSDVDAIVEALKSDWLTTGPLVEKFELELEKVVGAPTVTVTSGTAALHCAYAAIGIEPGDEVITPPITFIATQSTAALLGAKIVFVDVQHDTANIDPKSVEAAITHKTKAVVAVDYAGHPAELEELKSITEKHGIYLIEDAAHSIGSTYKNEPVGSIADITTFSFFPTKNLTTSEGGAICSRNIDLLDRARMFARQGLVRDSSHHLIQNEGPWHQEVHKFGLNYRLPDVLCALGVSQLKRLGAFKSKRRDIFDYYNREFENLDFIQIPTERPSVNVNWHLYPIQVPASHRASIFTTLRKKGIGVQVNYLPAHLHPVFHPDGFKRGDFPIAENFYDSELSLPIHFGMSESQIQQVVDSLKSVKL